MQRWCVADAEAAQATAQSLAYQYRLALPMARQGALSAQELESRRIASVTAAAEARAATAKVSAIGLPDGMGRLLIPSPISGQVAAVKTSPGRCSRLETRWRRSVMRGEANCVSWCRLCWPPTWRAASCCG